MTQPAYHYYTFEEYLALEEEATEKHEYYRGEIFVMSGGKPAHSQVASNINTILNTALRPFPCIVYTSDLRVYIEAADFSTYADVTVICGDLQYYQNHTDVVTNPLLMVEVLSPSTKNFDQTTKFKRYRMLPSFEHYVVVDPNAFYVEYHQKTGFFWQVSYYDQPEQQVVLQLPHGVVELPLALVYEKVTFPPPLPPKPKKTKKRSR